MFAAQDQGTRRAGLRGLTRNRHGAMAQRLRRAAAGAACAAAIAFPLVGAAGAQAATTITTYTPLTLINGWANYGSGTANAAVTSVNGIVHFKGAIKASSGAQHLRDRASQGRYLDQRDERRSVRPPGRIPARQPGLHPGGPCAAGTTGG